MIKQIVLELKWLPNTIGSLFIDDKDYLGLEYWYDTVYEMLKPKKNKTSGS